MNLQSQPLYNHIFVLFEMFGKHVVDIASYRAAVNIAV